MVRGTYSSNFFLVFLIISVNGYSQWSCQSCKCIDCPIIQSINQKHESDSLIFEMDCLVNNAAAQNTVDSWRKLADFCEVHARNSESAEFALFGGIANSRMSRLKSSTSEKKENIERAIRYFELVMQLCDRKTDYICSAKVRGLNITQHNKYEQAIAYFYLKDYYMSWFFLEKGFSEGACVESWYFDFIAHFFGKLIDSQQLPQLLPTITFWYRSLHEVHMSHWPYWHHYPNLHIGFH